MISRDRQIAGGAVLSYASIAFSIIAGLLYTPWMVRQIGQSQYGLYTLATSLISMFLIDFGLSATTARFVSRYHAEGDGERINRLLGTIYQLYLIIDAIILVVFIAIYFLSDTIYRTLSPEDLKQFKVIYLIAAGFNVISFPFVTLNGIMTAHELFIQQKLADLLRQVFTILLVVIALLNGMGLFALVTANAVSGLAVIAYKLFAIRRHTSVRVRFVRFSKPLLRELLGFSAWVTLDALAARLIFNITPSILGVVASTSSIAVFGIVTVIEGHTYTITNAINGMFMPKVSRIVVGSETGNSLQSLFLRVGKFQLSINGLIMACFVVLGRDFLRLWMGESYLDAYVGIVLVLFPGLFLSAMQIGNTIVYVRNRVRFTALVNFFTGLFNVLLSFILSARLGVTGASMSICTAYMVRAVALSWFYHNKLDIDILEFSRKCYLRIAPGIVCTIAAGLLLKSVLSTDSWLRLGGFGGVLCIVYAALLSVFGFDAAEKAGIVRTIRRFLHRR